MFHYPRFLTLPIPILLVGALVMSFLTLGDANFNFYLAACPVHIRWHHCESFTVNQAGDPIDFPSMQ